MFSSAAPTEPVRTTRPDAAEPQNNTTLDLLSPCGTASLAQWGRVHVPDPSAGLGSVQHAADVLLEITRLICEQFSPLRRTEESDPAQTRVLFLCGCFRGTDPEPEPEPEQFL